MSMTRKDYVKIADVVSKYRLGMSEDDYLDLVHDLCVIFENDNDSFQPDTFKEAVGVI